MLRWKKKINKHQLNKYQTFFVTENTIDLKDVDVIVSIIPSILQLGRDVIGFVWGKRIWTRSRSLLFAAYMIAIFPFCVVKTKKGGNSTMKH
jgi:hypothetical protein